MPRKTVFFVWLLIVLMVGFSGCQSTPTPEPTMDPSVWTQTAVAAQTLEQGTQEALQTAQARLNVTPSPTLTSTPAPTRTATPTVTLTITQVPTRTSTPLPSATITNTPSPFTCRLVSQVPRDGSTIKPNTQFTVTWTVQNMGKALWENIAIDLMQLGGDKIAVQTIYDLPHTVKPGEMVNLQVELKAPEATGYYRTDWKLAIVDQGFTFCPLYVDFWVSDR
ncbi:NBR1-Ig-like domain-containing protein [Anaerolinea sp.]|uniref:NBR1-Ig-like domain-containing protein n=1 Tax=Anaerolinea sp. TaxID=1872519 RepID=UPI002ACDADBF|nr:NBR1-Ig-like domain-containing protein [Anaerolinea sp.]